MICYPFCPILYIYVDFVNITLYVQEYKFFKFKFYFRLRLHLVKPTAFFLNINTQVKENSYYYRLTTYLTEQSLKTGTT